MAMALLINYTRFIPRIIGCACQRGIRRGSGKIFNLKASPFRSVRFNEILCRTSVSLAKEKPERSYDVDDMLHRLYEDIQIRNVFFNDVRDVFLAVKKRGKITDAEFLLFIRCCSEISLLSTPNERVEFAEEVWRTAAESGMKFTETHYNALLNLYVECNHKFSYSQFLNDMRKEGLEPTLVTLNKLLKAQCQRGDCAGANEILTEMKKKNFPLSQDEFTSLVQCYAISGDFEKSNEILKLMEDRDIDPSPWAFTYLLCGYAKHGKIEEIRNMLEELPNKGVKFSNLHLAEIFYALVSNNYGEHSQMILDKMTSDFSKNKRTMRVIHRLIREKYDTAAFQLFEKLNTIDVTSDSVLLYSKLILKHFALYREPADILEAIEIMDKKGWIKTGLSVVLRQIYKHKDEDFCVDFLRKMMSLKMKVGSSYFWPAIIKASKKKDTKKVHQILKYINRRLIDCEYTTTKILYLHYPFSDDWRSDYETLYKHGCPAKWLSITLIKVLLEKNKSNEALKLAAEYPIDVRRSSNIFQFLVDHIQRYPDQVSDFLDILYYLSHDSYLEQCKKKSPEQNASEDQGDLVVNVAYDNAIFTLQRNLYNEEVAQMILENMLEKKMWLSSETVSICQREFPVKFHELLQKLTNHDFRWKPEENVLKSKKSWTTIFDDLTNGTKNKNQQHQQKQQLPPATPFRIVTELSKKKDFSQLKKVLPELMENKSEVERAIWLSIVNWISKKQVNVAENLFELAVSANVFSELDCLIFIRLLLKSGIAAEAVKKYVEFSEKSSSIPRHFEFLQKLVSYDEEAPLNTFCHLISRFLQKDQFLTMLVIAYASVGKLEKAREVMSRDHFLFRQRQLEKHISFKFNFISSETLEIFLDLIKDRPEIDRVNLYKLMIRKYASEKKLNKIKDLWMLIEEDDISNYFFLEQVRDIVDHPSQEALDKLAVEFEKLNAYKSLVANMVKS